MAGAPHTEGVRDEGMRVQADVRVHVLHSLVMRGLVGNRLPSPSVSTSVELHLELEFGIPKCTLFHSIAFC